MRVTLRSAKGTNNDTSPKAIAASAVMRAAPDPRAIQNRGQRQPIPVVDPPSAPPSAVPASAPRRVGQVPPMTGIGGQNISLCRTRIGEISRAIAMWSDDLPTLARGENYCVAPLSPLLDLVERASAAVTTQMTASESTARDMAAQMAREMLRGQTFGVAAQRFAAEEAAADKILNDSRLKLIDQVAERMSAPSAKAVGTAVGFILAARDALAKARNDAAFPADFDEDFLRRASVITQSVAGMPPDRRMKYLADRYDADVLANQDDRLLLLEYAGRPLAFAVAEKGAADLRNRTSQQFLKTGDASAELAAAVRFLKASDFQMKMRVRTDSIALAAETLKQIEEVFLRICGRDPSESMTRAQRNATYSTATSDLAVAADRDGVPRWLARFCRAEASIQLRPWELLDPSAAAVRGAK